VFDGSGLTGAAKRRYDLMKMNPGLNICGPLPEDLEANKKITINRAWLDRIR
jgi:hypothetical protein